MVTMTDEGVYISEINGHKVYLKDGHYYVEIEEDSGETSFLDLGFPMTDIVEAPLDAIAPSATSIADSTTRVLRMDSGSSTLSWGPTTTVSSDTLTATAVDTLTIGTTSSYIDPWWHSIKVERSAGGHWPGAVEAERRRRGDILNDGIMKNIGDLQLWLAENVRTVIGGYAHCFNASDVRDGREFIDNGGFLD